MPSLWGCNLQWQSHRAGSGGCQPHLSHPGLQLSSGGRARPPPEGSTPGWPQRGSPVPVVQIPRAARSRGCSGMSWLSPIQGGTSLSPIPALTCLWIIIQGWDAGWGGVGMGERSGVPSGQGSSVPAVSPRWNPGCPQVLWCGSSAVPAGCGGVCGGWAALPSPLAGSLIPSVRHGGGSGRSPRGLRRWGAVGAARPPRPARCQPGVTCRSVAPEHAQLRLRLRLPLGLGLGLGMAGEMQRP